MIQQTLRFYNVLTCILHNNYTAVDCKLLSSTLLHIANREHIGPHLFYAVMKTNKIVKTKGYGLVTLPLGKQPNKEIPALSEAILYIHFTF